MVNEKYNIERQLELIKEENERLMMNLKRKAIEQEQRIIEL